MFNTLKKIPRFRKHVKPQDLDALYERVNKLSKISGAEGISVTTGANGVNIRNMRGSELPGSPKIYEVRSTPSGDGIYPVIENQFDATDWDDTAGTEKFEPVAGDSWKYIFSLQENYPAAAYTTAAGLYDKYVGWLFKDDEGNQRLMGLPLDGAQVRMARTTEAAPAAQNITCNLMGGDGTEISSGVGSAIEVYCKVCGGGNLNSAIPRLANNDYIFVVNLRGVWYCTTVFQTSENCDCYTAP